MAQSSKILLVAFFLYYICSLHVASSNSFRLVRRQSINVGSNGTNLGNSNSGSSAGGGNSNSNNNINNNNNNNSSSSGNSNSTDNSNGSGTIDANDTSVISGTNSTGNSIAMVNWLVPKILQKSAGDYPVIPAGSEPPFNIAWNLTNVRIQPKALTLEYKEVNPSTQQDSWILVDNKIAPTVTNYTWYVPGNVPEAKDYRLRLYDSDLGPNNVKAGSIMPSVSGVFYVYKPRDLTVPVSLPSSAPSSMGICTIYSIGLTLVIQQAILLI